MKPCRTCGEQPTVTIRAPEEYEFVGSCRIHCCDHYVCADGMVDAIEAWERGTRLINIGLTEITSL
jgi:hypothetical protein